MKALKVPLKDAQKVHTELVKKKIFDFNYLISKDKTHIYFPVVKKINGYNLVEKKFKKHIKKKSYEELLKEILTKKEYDALTRSYDVAGNIAILEIPEELRKKEKDIARALLKSQAGLKTILVKDDMHRGTYRRQKLRYLVGKRTKKAIHKENNVKISLDVEKVYFSVRTSNERKRIVRLVKKNEEILVMFSGCAPLPIVISKNTKAKHIDGIELNPIAHKYAEDNVKLNKLKNITLYHDDVRKRIPKLKKKYDRILMPLPKIADEFLVDALKVAKKGTIIHLYLFLSENQYDDTKKHIKDILGKIKHKVLRFVKCGNYSPGIFRTSVDIQLT